jgi:hypothetical protein
MSNCTHSRRWFFAPMLSTSAVGIWWCPECGAVRYDIRVRWIKPGNVHKAIITHNRQWEGLKRRHPQRHRWATVFEE